MSLCGHWNTPLISNEALGPHCRGGGPPSYPYFSLSMLPPKTIFLTDSIFFAKHYHLVYSKDRFLLPHGWLELEITRDRFLRRGLRQAPGAGRPYRYEVQKAIFEWCFRMTTLVTNFGTDSTNDRLVSMPYHENAQIHASARGNCHAGHALHFGSILPFFNGQVECATCHDPHDTYHGNTTMLRQPLARPAPCLHCHNR